MFQCLDSPGRVNILNVFKQLKIDNLKQNLLPSRRERYTYLGVVLFVSLLAFISLRRQVLNYGTETDFLWQFVPDAARFLNGERLHLEFHPPFYPVVIALIYSVTGNWMKAGLILSMISCVAVMAACYKFFKLRFGEIEGMGGIFALAISASFVHYSAQATTDIFFMALFFSALAFIALAEDRHKALYWLLAGAFTGMAIMTRTNGMALIGFLLFPICSAGAKVSKNRAVTLMVAGILMPVSTWISFAIFSGSPVFPTSGHKAIALSYFSGGSDRTSIDALVKASEGLTDTRQVLAKDPQHIVRTYAEDLVYKANKLVTEHDLLPFPYIQLAMAGLTFLIFTKFNRFKQALAFNLLGMFLLLNFAPWVVRYHLYLVPFMGAGIIGLLYHIYKMMGKRFNSALLVIAICFSFIFGLQKLRNTVVHSFSNLAFDSLEASTILKTNNNSPSSIVLARKPHLSFYAGLDYHLFPDSEGMEELKTALKEMAAHQADKKTIYLFYGYFERVTRPSLAALGNLDLNVYWLSRIAWGKGNGGWILYEILRDKLKTDQDAYRSDTTRKSD